MKNKSWKITLRFNASEIKKTYFRDFIIFLFVLEFKWIPIKKIVFYEVDYKNLFLIKFESILIEVDTILDNTQ